MEKGMSSKDEILRCVETTHENKRCKIKFHREQGIYCHIHRKNKLTEIMDKKLNDFRDISGEEYCENSLITIILFMIYFIFYFWINFWFLA
jgi:hypothetical protein